MLAHTHLWWQWHRRHGQRRLRWALDAYFARLARIMARKKKKKHPERGRLSIWAMCTCNVSECGKGCARHASRPRELPVTQTRRRSVPDATCFSLLAGNSIRLSLASSICSMIECLFTGWSVFPFNRRLPSHYGVRQVVLFLSFSWIETDLARVPSSKYYGLHLLYIYI